jgi:hypothetical protein
MEQHSAGAAYYEIQLAGRLDPAWADWFDGLSIRYEDDGTTVLAGVLADQAALHGRLAAVRDLALTLVAIRSRPVRGP